MKHTIHCLLLSALFYIIGVPAQAQHAEVSLFDDWTGKLQVGPASLTIVIHLSKNNEGKPEVSFDSPDQGAGDIPAEVKFISVDSVSLNIPSLFASYRGRLHGDSLVGTFKQGFQSFPLSFARGAEQLRRPQMPQLPLPYRTEEIRFNNDGAGITLAGTFTHPASPSVDFPIVIFVSGSGLQDRDETIFGHKPFAVLADHLARQGIASLRYDDRGTGLSEGKNLSGATTLDFRNDALAAVQAMRTRFPKAAVGLLGHSEGANIAWMLAAEGKIDFAVGLAGTAVKGDTALTEQVNRISALNGQPPSMNVEMYRRIIAQQANPWLQWFIDYDPSKDLKNARCPIFALYGENDCQVIAKQNMPAAQRLLEGKKHSRAKTYPKLNHLFQHSTTGLLVEYRQIEETMSEEVMQDITAWIKECCH